MIKASSYNESYAARRAEIIAVSNQHRQGEPVPYVNYLPEEHTAWHVLLSNLASMHDQHACEEYLIHAPKLGLEPSKLEQLNVISQRLEALMGWRLEPASTLVDNDEFFAGLNQRIFPATQFLRDPRTPFFSDEPDYIHELIGHAAALTSPRISRLYEMFGAAAQQVAADQLDNLMRVFWWSCEVGIIFEHGKRKVIGAALLSSVGEMKHIQDDAIVRPFDIEEMIRTESDYTKYQSVYFGASSFNHFMEVLEGYLKSYW